MKSLKIILLLVVFAVSFSGTNEETQEAQVIEYAKIDKTEFKAMVHSKPKKQKPGNALN